MDAKEQTKLLKWHELATAKEENRPVLTYSYADDTALVSADGFRMHITYGDFRALADDGGFIHHKRSVDASTQYNRKFPHWAAVVASLDNAYESTCLVANLKHAVKLARILSKDNGDVIKLVLHTDSIFVIGASYLYGDVTSRVPARRVSCTTFDPLVIATTGGAVLDALDGFADDAIISIKTGRVNDMFRIGTDDRFAVISPKLLGSTRLGTGKPTPEQVAAAAAEVLALCDLSLPRGSELPKSTPLHKPVRKTKEEREQAKRRKEREQTIDVKSRADAERLRGDFLTGRTFITWANGASVEGYVTHDPVASTLVTYTESLRWSLLWNADKHIGIRIHGEALELITKHESGLEVSRLAYDDGALTASKVVLRDGIETAYRTETITRKQITARDILRQVKRTYPDYTYVRLPAVAASLPSYA